MDRIGGYGRGIRGGRYGQRNHGDAGRSTQGARGRGDRNQVRGSRIDISNLIGKPREDQLKIITSIINKTCKSLADVNQLLDQMEIYNIAPNEVAYNSIINRHC